MRVWDQNHVQLGEGDVDILFCRPVYVWVGPKSCNPTVSEGNVVTLFCRPVGRGGAISCNIIIINTTVSEGDMVTCPYRLIFTWWECCGLCLSVWHKPTKLAHSFLFHSCVCFCLFGPFNCISFHTFSRQLCFLTLFFRSYFCLIGPFNYISFYESLLQLWYNTFWLTWFKAPAN